MARYSSSGARVAKRQKNKEPAFKKKKKSRVSFLVLFAAVAVFCGYIFFRGFSLYNDKVNLQSEISSLNQQIENENKRTEELKEQETYMHTKKYAEEVAKDVLGYVYEDEIIFKPEK